MGHEQQQLLANFQENFVVTLADRPVLLDYTQQIRYRVYCEEFAYFPLEDYPSQREADEFDQSAWHCLVSQRRNNTPAACVRLVKPTITEIGLLLPFEKTCRHALDIELLKRMNLDRQTCAEISRLAVDKAFRRRLGETGSRFGDVLDFTHFAKRNGSLLTVTAFFAAVALAELTGRTHLFALLEPFLVTLLQGFGIPCQRVGKDADYHGIRAPHLMTTQLLLKNMDPDMAIFYLWVKQQLEKNKDSLG